MCIIWGMKGVCLTGNRPHKMPFAENSESGKALKARIVSAVGALADEGYTLFISGMAPGADMYFAEAVLTLKSERGLTLEAAVPFPGQSRSFSAHDRGRYEKILANADKVTVLGQNYTPYCYFVRNRYMVESSDVVLTVDYGSSGGTASTVAYAKKLEKRIINLVEQN